MSNMKHLVKVNNKTLLHANRPFSTGNDGKIEKVGKLCSKAMELA